METGSGQNGKTGNFFRFLFSTKYMVENIFFLIQESAFMAKLVSF